MKATHYRFADFRLDVAARELWRGDERVQIAAKAFDCLAYLIEHRSRAVGRDELTAAVWGLADGGDNLLTQAIWRLRRTLGDDGDGEGPLRTVPRFGYRWTMPVLVDDAGIAAADPADSPAESPTSAGPATVADPAHAATLRQPPPAPHRVARSRWLAACVALVVVSALAIMFVRDARIAVGPTASTAPANDSRTVVVLPVGVSETSTDHAWLRYGAMDYLASRLRDARLGVMPSDRVVAIARSAPAGGPDAAERERLLRVTGTGYLLVPRATTADGVWRFSLDAYHGEHARTYVAEAAAPLLAVDAVAAQFLADLGIGASTRAAGAMDELAQRIDAATLGGDVAEARRWLDTATPEQAGDPRLVLRRARLEFRNGRLEEAEAAFEPLASGTVDVPASMRALAQMGLGGIAIRRRHYGEAEPFYSAAIATLGEQGDPSLRGRAYNERAVVNGGLGRLDLALADMGRARSELERSGDPIGLAYADINTALLAGQHGQQADAAAAFDRAIATFDRFDIADGLATALANKANARLRVLDARGAVDSSARAWRLLPGLQDHRLIEYVAQNHIRALRENGRLAEARTALARFDGDATASADPAFATLRAGLLVDEGKGALAFKLGGEILERIRHAPAGSCSDTIPEAAVVLTEAARQGGRADDAGALVARLGELLESPEDPGWAFASELSRALILAASGDGEADHHFAAHSRSP
ncbi:DNA-binding winged helix-turn-helix (wHTH) protein/tetratricopeptide (TPR) repeat protein [Dokdonella fugitiva]|uniref:DNA-binding winged helix-turn-helix (WHTH) protein/tetratricopeptide (TPR) repeat protein n=1 Tax=Dokdonella fugitiva TaxID=328517 RepID=A0A839F3Y0_9GAMM|nr:winged helix-turn-helix domain-containing protein [Dokdonella fugitiva]MBA8887004.1 DNA-binding winged helix-turn-helix (wHTH) protein/tetratricopeptide (TPR) repeat protein [Dokdonella fugitiva]